jgi:hypothetical protein
MSFCGNSKIQRNIDNSIKLKYSLVQNVESFILLNHKISNLWVALIIHEPVTVAERSRACTVFARLETGIMGSNPTQGMDV